MRRAAIGVLAIAWALAVPAWVVAGVPQGKPPPQPAHAKPSASSKPPKRGSSPTEWTAAADAACSQGLAARKALLTDVGLHPSSTARGTLLRILGGTVSIESRMLSSLAPLQPPRQVRASFRAASRLFRTRHAEDRTLVVALRTHWNIRLLERQTRRDRMLNARLARRFAALGATGCSAYFRSLHT
jgi:hypothetical protein